MKNLRILKAVLCGMPAALAAVLILFSCSRDREDSGELVRQAAGAVTGEKADWKKAGELAARALKKNPRDDNAHVILSLSLDYGGRRGAALEEIKKAAELNPQNFLALFTKGRFLYEAGKYGDCIAPLRDAARLRPGNDSAVLLLAKSLSNLERNDEALSCYKQLAKSQKYGGRPEPFNELGVIYFKQRDYQKAALCFAEAYKKGASNHIVVLNYAVFCDFFKRSAEAVKLYNRYQELTLRNHELDVKRQKIQKRIDLLKRQGGA